MARIVRYRHRYTAREIKRMLSAFESADCSMTAFARSRGIAPATLRRWLRRRSEAEDAERSMTRLVPVEVVASPVVAEDPVEIVLTNGRVIRVRASFDAEALGRLLPIVERGC